MKKIIFTLTFVFVAIAGYSQVIYSKNIYGNTVAKDQYGNKLGTYSKDIYGNTIYTPNK